MSVHLKKLNSITDFVDIVPALFLPYIGDPVNRVGLEDCDVCATRPCKNGGSCREVSGAWGFVCICRPGYSGRTCQGAGQRCSPGVCNEGRCENVGEDGFKCICPAGYSGERCEEGVL